MTELVSVPKRRGRPRDPEVDRRVRAAALDEVAERGLAGFSMQRVAARAGVSRASVHLRWATPRDLVSEALAEAVMVPDVPDSGSLVSDLVHVVAELCEVLRPPRLAVQLRTMLDAGLEGRRDILGMIMDTGILAVVRVFERARARGELAAGLDPMLLTSALIGTVLFEATVSASLSPPDAARQQEIVALFGQGTRWLS